MMKWIAGQPPEVEEYLGFESYLVTCKFGTGYKVCEADWVRFRRDGKMGCRWEIPSGELRSSDVIAYMPLPEPYVGSEE